MEGVPPPVIAGLQPLHRWRLVVVGKVKGRMIQVLSGAMTGLCRECRFAGPKAVNNRWVWRCRHTRVEIIEGDGRIIARRIDSETL